MKRPEPNYAWIGVCPACSQGRQLIARNNNSGKLFILCEDCYAEWRSPEEARDLDAPAPDTSGPCTMLTREDIADHPWRKFVEGENDKHVS
jgi:hypothetical protein